MVDPPPTRASLADSLEDEQLVDRLRTVTGSGRELELRRKLEALAAGQYEILETLGQGAGGVVFKARDLKLKRLLAIKCFAAAGDEHAVARAFEEARLLANVTHPNIASVYAISESTAVPFIAMELVDGFPITQALAGRPVREQVSAFAQALGAVAALHRAGLTHRDLKPANILVNSQGQVKLVDFGIARVVNALSPAQGTPAYLAPEQSAGQAAQPSADVFSAGVVLFEMLTGQRPFVGPTRREVLTAIRQGDPPLPRSLREEIPGAMQAICLTAMEKEPGRRYPSAHEFLLDLRRWMEGQPVLANPTLLAATLEHGIDRHVTDIRRWQGDRMISARECDYFLDKYGRLRQRQESWVLDSRRISFSQVVLHLGVWSCAVSAFLMLAFPWPGLHWARPALPAALSAILLVGGSLLWRRGVPRVALVMLIGGTVILPVAVATALAHFRILAVPQPDRELLSGLATNNQLLIATAVFVLMSLAAWRATRTAAFAILSAISLIAFVTVGFGRLGLRTQWEAGHFDTVAGWYLGLGAVLLLIAMAWDLRWRIESFASPFYVFALFFLLSSLTVIARFGPTLQWLHLTGAAQGDVLGRQIDYSFMINGVLYLTVGFLVDRSASSAWLRWIGNLLFWLAPSHLLLPVLHLEDQWPIGATGWTVPELILPVAALAFVFISVPKQMKSFFFSGLFYAAIAVQRLTARHFEDRFAWPVSLAAAGLLLTLIAWRRPAWLDAKHSRTRDANSKLPKVS
ncbi:MAG TPA: serine/threonine-protein kinase [Tepidisphaeraceae bacterium]|jgi:serine/threonine-protein kinase